MKRMFGLGITLMALAFATGALATPFTSGNLVIYRMGGDVNGNTVSGGLTNRGSVVWIDEYTPAGSRVQSIQFPTDYYGANSPFVDNGTAFGNGLITRSVDGRFILATGFGATPGQFSLSVASSTFATEAPRIVATVDQNGNINTTTALTNSIYNNSQLRSAVSTDGTNLWFAGDGLGGAAIDYTTRGNNVSTNFPGLTNVRQLGIFSNQLYFSTASGVNPIVIVTNSVPFTIPTTTNGVLETGLPGMTNVGPWAFAAFKLAVGGSDPIDTLYVADGGQSVYKYALVGGTWVQLGTMQAFHAVGLVGQKRVVGSVTNVDLYVTGGGGTLTGGDNLTTATDATGYNVAPNTNPDDTILATANGQVSFRGIAFAPVGAETVPSDPGYLSVGPVLGLFSSGLTGCGILTPSVLSTQTYSVANLGNSTINWSASCDGNYVDLTPASGTLVAGGSITVTALFNANITSLPTGTNSATITFTNTTSAVGTTTREVRLIERDQSVSPTTDFISSGGFTGPFSPTSKVYTVKNGSTPTTLWVTNKPAATWLNLSPAGTISLGSCSSVDITASIVSNAAAGLAVGNYVSSIIFSNASTGGVIDSDNAQILVGGTFFCDDFSTFVQNSVLAGQQGWVNFGGTANDPLVTNNAVYVAAFSGGVAADEPYKNIPLTSNGNVYAAMVMTVTSAPPVATISPSRIITFFQTANSGGYARDSLSVRDTDTNQFVFCVRNNGITVNAYQFGSTPLNYNQSYRVIVKGEDGNTNTTVYVNPGSATEGANTPYVVMHLVSGSDFHFGSIQIGNTFGSFSGVIPGVAFSKICITTNFAEAYNDTLTSGPPSDPYTTWQSQYFGCTGCGQAAGGADPDGDGMSNTNEFLAGFNPTNNAAYVHVISAVRTDGTNVTVTYLGANGNSTTVPAMASRTNVLEISLGGVGGSTGNNYSNNFTSAQTKILSGGTGLGGVSSFIDTNGASGLTRYYRIRVLVP